MVMDNKMLLLKIRAISKIMLEAQTLNINSIESLIELKMIRLKAKVIS